MNNKYYVFITEDCEKETAELTAPIKALNVPGCAVLVIGKNPDMVKLKQEVNYVTSSDYKLFCLMYGNPDLDQGLKLQLGLAKKYAGDSDSVEALIADIKNNKPKLGKAKLIICLAICAIAIAGILAFVLNLVSPASPGSKLSMQDATQSSQTASANRNTQSFADVSNSSQSSPSETIQNPSDPQQSTAPSNNSGQNPSSSTQSDIIIDMDDVYLSVLVNIGADLNGDGSISKIEMESVTVLNLSGKGIDNLEPLLYAKNLTELDLSNNNITDITNLAALSKLEKINLQGNQIKDYSVLDYLPNLKEIQK